MTGEVVLEAALFVCLALAVHIYFGAGGGK